MPSSPMPTRQIALAPDASSAAALIVSVPAMTMSKPAMTLPTSSALSRRASGLIVVSMPASARIFNGAGSIVPNGTVVTIARMRVDVICSEWTGGECRAQNFPRRGILGGRRAQKGVLVGTVQALVDRRNGQFVRTESIGIDAAQIEPARHAGDRSTVGGTLDLVGRDEQERLAEQHRERHRGARMAEHQTASAHQFGGAADIRQADADRSGHQA